jgi:hypothetical protein
VAAIPQRTSFARVLFVLAAVVVVLVGVRLAAPVLNPMVSAPKVSFDSSMAARKVHWLPLLVEVSHLASERFLSSPSPVLLTVNVLTASAGLAPTTNVPAATSSVATIISNPSATTLLPTGSPLAFSTIIFLVASLVFWAGSYPRSLLEGGQRAVLRLHATPPCVT